MAADDDLGLDDNGDVGESTPQKKGGLGALLPTLLKWIAIVVAAIILIVTVVVITMNIMNKNGSTTTSIIPSSSDYKPKKEDLSWYTSIGQVSTTSNDTPAAAVIMDVALGYKEDDKVASAEITKRTIEIKEFLRRYFSSKSKNEMRVADEDTMKIEIRNGINDDILVDSKIRDVIFQTHTVVE